MGERQFSQGSCRRILAVPGAGVPWSRLANQSAEISLMMIDAVLRIFQIRLANQSAEFSPMVLDAMLWSLQITLANQSAKVSPLIINPMLWSL